MKTLKHRLSRLPLPPWDLAHPLRRLRPRLPPLLLLRGCLEAGPVPEAGLGGGLLSLPHRQAPGLKVGRLCRVLRRNPMIAIVGYSKLIRCAVTISRVAFVAGP